MGASKASRAMAQARKLMQDEGESPEGGKGSLRTCVVTRAKLAPDELLRFVLSPEGIATPDLRRKLPGRGVWVQTSRDALAEALRRKAFTRGFKAPVNAPADLPELVEALLLKDALQSLAMANKAGQAFAGAFKVEAEIAEIAKLDEKKSRLLARKKVIEELQANRSQMVHLCDELVRTIPDGVILTSIKQDGDKLILEGRTQSNARISTYMRIVVTAQWIGGPEL
jgi:predicted RNA-binding protein YlxR (DUF448 family)